VTGRLQHLHERRGSVGAQDPGASVLEGKGLLEGRPGQGTFVRATIGTVPFAAHASLRKALATWIASARAAGLDDTGIAALFATTLHDTRSETVA